jgi:hypothetical protein
VPALANGDPATAVSEPLTLLMLNTETDAWWETARNRPSPDIFMPTMGEGNKEAVEDRLNEPFTAMLKVLIWPLLDAIKNRPSGVAASEMPAQLSRVSPLGKGDPATAANTPVAGVMRNTLIQTGASACKNSHFLTRPFSANQFASREVFGGIFIEFSGTLKNMLPVHISRPESYGFGAVSTQTNFAASPHEIPCEAPRLMNMG